MTLCRWVDCGAGGFDDRPLAQDMKAGPFSGHRMQDMERARGCFRHLRTLFQELEECRAFELLKGQADRVNYLSTKQVCGCGVERLWS